MTREAAFAIRMRLLDRRWDPTADEPIPGLGGIYDFIVNEQPVATTITEHRRCVRMRPSGRAPPPPRVRQWSR